MAASIELLRDEAVVPAQERVWGSHRGDFFEACTTEWLCERCEAAAFRVGETEPAATKLGFEDAILFLKIGDNSLLVTVKPSGQHSQEELQDHGLSSGWRQ